MAFRTQGQGWFYHAPARNEHTEAIGHPPLSQIPGLSNLSHLPPEPENMRMWIKDSDSRYIQLAKAGGRPDLLRTHTPPPLSGSAVGYPRCEWYYDNQSTNNSQPTQPYEFGIPDYMVQMPLRNEGSKRSDPRPCARAPFADDKTTVFDREGDRATDKTIKIKENRQQGYGVRTEKAKYQVGGSASEAEGQDTAGPGIEFTGQKQSSMLSTGQANMTKLLGYGYAKDYEKQKEKWRQNLSRHGTAPYDMAAATDSAANYRKRY